MILLPQGERYACETRLIVPPYDCDGAMRLKLSSALRYVERVSTGHLEKMGLGHARLHGEGIVFVLAALAIKVDRLPLMLEAVVIKTCPAAQVGVQLVRETVIESETGEPLLEIQAGWVMIDPATRRPLRPSTFRYTLPMLSDWRPFINPAKIRIQPAETPAIRQTVRFSHIDLNGHMNNTVYADLIMDALPFREAMEKSPHEMLIKLRREALIGDVIELRRDKSENGYRVSGHIDGECCFESEMRLWDRSQA